MTTNEEQFQSDPSGLLLAALRDAPLSEADLVAKVPENLQRSVGATLERLQADARIHLDLRHRYHTTRKSLLHSNMATVHAFLAEHGPMTSRQLADEFGSDVPTVEYACGLLVAQRVVSLTFRDPDRAAVFSSIVGAP